MNCEEYRTVIWQRIGRNSLAKSEKWEAERGFSPLQRMEKKDIDHIQSGIPHSVAHDMDVTNQIIRHRQQYR